MSGRTDSRPRLLVVLVAFGLIGVSLLGRLAWWQVVQYDSLSQAALRQSTARFEQPVRRGTIFDRTGTVVLATTITRYRVVAAADQLTPAERSAAASALSAILGLDPDAATVLANALQTGRPYVILARDVDQATADRIRSSSTDGDLRGLGISLEPEPVRVYPQQGAAAGTSLAAHLLGFVNHDGQGQYGVEQWYQKQLAGSPQVLFADRDSLGRPMTDTAQIISPGVPGADLRLTIDGNLQLAIEEEVLAAYTADSAVSVSAVVLDPNSGAIMAEASYPSYDANNYGAVALKDPSRFIDPIVSDIYEPGSVFKMFTAIAAIERGTITPLTKIHDTGTMLLDGGKARVSDADLRPMGWLPAQDIVAYSRNVGAARIALGLAPTLAQASSILAATWARFGFGQPTGVDLAGEASGIVNDPAITPWRQIDLANGSFGQGVAVTELQLAIAYAALVNGGTLVQPHVVEGIGSQDVPRPEPTRVTSPVVSRMMVDLMAHVVKTVPWYAAKTLIKGFDVGGKTGTAQIWDARANHGRGAWMNDRFNHTFVGYIGRGQPELVIAVVIHEPRPLQISQGNLPLAVESYALFRRIATDSMATLDLPKPSPTSAPPGQ